MFWKFGTREVQDGDEIIERKSVLCRYYTVFNTSQCEGLPVKPAEATEPVPHINPIESCEQVVTPVAGQAHHSARKPPCLLQQVVRPGSDARSSQL